MTSHFDESTITGTRLMSGSDAMRLRNRTIASTPSIMPSSMLTSITCAPFSTCWRATVRAVEKSPALIRLRKRADPVMFVRSPTFTKRVSSTTVTGSSPARRRAGVVVGGTRGRLVRDPARDRLDVRRRRAAAPADEVHEARVGELGEDRRRLVRRLVVLAEGVGQPGVRVAADEGVRDARHLGDVGAHLLGAERAVEADEQGLGVAHRVPERLGDLPRQGPARRVRDRPGDDHRPAATVVGEDRLDREDGGLGVERVEDRLDEDEVGSHRRAGHGSRSCRRRPARRT